MAEKRVITEHPKTGERYGVTVATHRKEYEPRGFKIVGYESGEPYEPPETPKAAAQSAKKD